MTTVITPQNGKKFTASEKMAIVQAEAIATRLSNIYKETETLMKEIGSNRFLVKKGVNVVCNATTGPNKNGKKTVFRFNCNIAVPNEIIK